LLTHKIEHAAALLERFDVGGDFIRLPLHEKPREELFGTALC
jgi:hypothetical protein